MSAVSMLEWPGFLAYALAVENEAVERYTTFAEQMEVTNNQEVARLFREMARLEERHARDIEAQAASAALPDLPAWEFDWPEGCAPEAVDFADAHYLMNPYQALTLVLEAEQRAVAFFETVAQATEHDKVRQLAVAFAAEEREHVARVRAWRERHPPPERDWDEDPDPPNQME